MLQLGRTPPRPFARRAAATARDRLDGGTPMRFPVGLLASLLANLAMAGIASAEEKVYHPREDVRLSDSAWMVVCAMEMGDTLRSDNDYQEDAKTSGRFVMVVYAVINEGAKTDRILIRPALVDSAGRQYEEYDHEEFYIPKKGGLQTIGLAQLTPNVQKNLCAIFEIAKDAKALMFRARSLASDDETALIALDICPDCGGHMVGEKECPKCEGSGHDANYDECRACEGRGKAPCAKCKGQGHVKPKAAPKKAEPPKADDPEAKARALLNVAEQFAKNRMVDKAIERLNEIVSKYPDTETAKAAKARIEELQAAEGPSK